MKRIIILFFSILFFGCTNTKNNPEFIKTFTGNYLFNSDESIGVAFENDEMMIRWRGNNQIKPLKVNDSTFYLKEMNEKLIFIDKPTIHIKLAEKREHKGKVYLFNKMKEGEKTPREYLLNKEFDKALAGYLIIQKKDSLDKTIRERTFNSLGYRYLRDKDFDTAIEIFKINTVLYPKSSNTYDSLGEAYWKKNDTVKAVENFKKALSINPENRRAIRFIKTHNLE